MTSNRRMTADLHAIAAHLAAQGLQEAASDLATRLRDLRNDSAKVLLLLDRPSAEDFVTKLQAALTACELVASMRVDE